MHFLFFLHLHFPEMDTFSIGVRKRERERTKKVYSWNIAGDSNVEMTGY